MLFKDIKEGDPVIMRHALRITAGGWRSGLSRYVNEQHIIEKVTMTQFVAGGYRFQRRDGSQFGGNEWTAHIPGSQINGPDGGLAVPTPDDQVNAWLKLRASLTQFQTRLMKLERDSATLMKTIAVRAVSPEDVAIELDRINALLSALGELQTGEVQS